MEENQRKPSRLVPGDDVPDDLQILPNPEDVRAGLKLCASGSARLDGAQEPLSNGQNSDDAYKACNRARVQEGIKEPPPPVGSEPGEVDNAQDDTFKEVRDLFTSDALKDDLADKRRFTGSLLLTGIEVDLCPKRPSQAALLALWAGASLRTPSSIFSA